MCTISVAVGSGHCAKPAPSRRCRKVDVLTLTYRLSAMCCAEGDADAEPLFGRRQANKWDFRVQASFSPRCTNHITSPFLSLPSQMKHARMCCTEKQSRARVGAREASFGKASRSRKVGMGPGMMQG